MLTDVLNTSPIMLQGRRLVDDGSRPGRSCRGVTGGGGEEPARAAAPTPLQAAGAGKPRLTTPPRGSACRAKQNSPASERPQRPQRPRRIPNAAKAGTLRRPQRPRASVQTQVLLRRGPLGTLGTLGRRTVPR